MWLEDLKFAANYAVIQTDDQGEIVVALFVARFDARDFIKSQINPEDYEILDVSQMVKS